MSAKRDASKHPPAAKLEARGSGPKAATSGRRIVACPTCGKAVEWAQQSVYRPFCSERCKTVDLGAWASEKYRIPVAEDKDEPASARPDEPPTSAGKIRDR